LVAITITTIGTERFVRGFNRIGSEVQDFEEPFRIILGDFREVESGIFATEGASEGNPFPALTKKYAAWKEENFPGRAIMTLTGAFRAALTGRAAGTIERIEKKEAEFGANLPGMHRHQVGYRMPMRKIVQVSDTTKNRWNHVFVRWAAGLFEKHGISQYGQYRGMF
jgi:hypothetical protein